MIRQRVCCLLTFVPPRSVELLNAPELTAHLQRRGSDSGSYRPTGGSGDGTVDEDEVETDATGGGGERRGSNPQDHNSRRGSRGNAAAATDKKKGDKKRRRDKQGAGQSAANNSFKMNRQEETCQTESLSFTSRQYCVVKRKVN